MNIQTTDLANYVEISWCEVCEDHNLPDGDISPSQQSRIDSAIEEINKVLIEFIEQNK